MPSPWLACLGHNSDGCLSWVTDRTRRFHIHGEPFAWPSAIRCHHHGHSAELRRLRRCVGLRNLSIAGKYQSAGTLVAIPIPTHSTADGSTLSNSKPRRSRADGSSSSAGHGKGGAYPRSFAYKGPVRSRGRAAHVRDGAEMRNGNRRSLPRGRGRPTDLLAAQGRTIARSLSTDASQAARADEGEHAADASGLRNGSPAILSR